MGRARSPEHALLEHRAHVAAPEVGDWPTLQLKALERAPSIAWDLLAVVGLTLAALAIRLALTRGLWLDEAIAVHEASLPFHGMLDALRTTDRHPPLYFALLWLDVRAFGTSELAVRLPSIVAGTLLVPALYLAGRELWNRATARVAATLGTVAPLAVWYAQEARMYAFFMLFAVLALWAQARVLRRGGVLDWLLYVIAAGLLVWTHYFALIQVVAQQVAFVVVGWQRSRRHLGGRGLLVGALVSLVLLSAIAFPVVRLAHGQLVAQGGGGLVEPVPAQVSLAPSQSDHLSVYRVATNGAWAVWGFHAGSIMSKLGSLWPFAMLLSLVLLGRRCSVSTGLVVALALVPPLVLAALSIARPELFEVRYVAGVVPMLVLLLARAATAWTVRAGTTAVVATAIFLTLLVGLEDQQLSGSNPRRYDFRAALTAVEQRAGKNDLLLYAPWYLHDIVRYYAPRVRSRPLHGNLASAANARRVFLVGSFLDHPRIAHATGAAVWRLEHQRHLAGHIQRHKVTTWVFR